MEKLGQILAEEKAKLRERQAAAEAVEQQDENVRTERSAREEEHMPQRKTSVKGLAGILKNRRTQDQEDETGHHSLKSGPDRDDTNHSVISHRRRHSENTG